MNDETDENPQIRLEQFRQDIVFETELAGRPFVFHSTWGVFSPRAIDEGTRLLIDHLSIEPTDNCIDLGCGYGPLGLVLASLAPQGTTHLIDKDFVAVDYSVKNAQVNDLNNVEVYLSNGFSHVPDAARFDVVVSNLPAKAGKELFYLYFYDALARMNPGAAIYVVTVNGLRGFIKRVFKDVFNDYQKLKQGKNYTISMARKPAA